MKGHSRSDDTPLELPAYLALLTMVLGTGAMFLAQHLLARRLGMRLSLVAAELVLLLPGLLALVLLGIPLLQGLRLSWPSPRAALLALGGGATLWIASLGLLEVQYSIWAPDPWYLEIFRRIHEALRPDGPLDALVSVAAIALAPALCEELLVRGIVLPSFQRAMGGPLAVLASAILFGLMHLDPYRLPFTFAVGLALGVLRLRTGSLAAPILAHAALNTLTFVVAPLVDDPSQPLPDPRPLMGAALLIGGTLLSWLLLRLLPPTDDQH